MNLTNGTRVKQIKRAAMKNSLRNQHYYLALHQVFTVDYHEINQYVLGLYNRPKQFIDETGPPIDRFLREYTLPGTPRSAELPTGVILDFIGQIDEFSQQAVILFNEHKLHVDQCAQYMHKASSHQRAQGDELLPELTADLTPELLAVHEGLKRIKEKADSMAERLEKLESRWENMKGVINR